jgi:hypothetical protein
MNEWMNEWMYEWMNVWMNEWMYEWMNDVVLAVIIKHLFEIEINSYDITLKNHCDFQGTTCKNNNSYWLFLTVR